MNRILHITPDFNYSCGRSKLVYSYTKYFTTCPDYEVHIITNGGDSLNRLENISGLKMERMDFSNGMKNIIYLRKFYKELKAYIVKNKIDLIHSHHRFPELVAVNLSKKLNLKTVFSTHGFVNGIKKLSFKSDVIISVSNSMSEYLTEYFKVSKMKIHMLYNPVELYDTSDFQLIARFKEQNQIIPNQKVVLYVGRFHFDKGFDLLIKSFKIISKKRNDLFLIMNGQYDKNLRILESIKNKDSTIIIGPQKDISYLYKVADVVVLPSRRDSFPYVMLEAGIYKRPFIGSKTGGIAEFIEDGKNGLLVNPENPEELAEKITFLLANPEVGKSLGENLHDKVSRLCDYNNYFREVEKIYNSLITSK